MRIRKACWASLHACATGPAKCVSSMVKPAPNTNSANASRRSTSRPNATWSYQYPAAQAMPNCRSQLAGDIRYLHTDVENAVSREEYGSLYEPACDPHGCGKCSKP